MNFELYKGWGCEVLHACTVKIRFVAVTESTDTTGLASVPQFAAIDSAPAMKRPRRSGNSKKLLEYEIRRALEKFYE